MFLSFFSLGFSIDLNEIDINNWEPLAVLSIAGIIPSLIIIANPLVSGSLLINLTAISFILCGISAIYLAFRLKKIKNRTEKKMDN
ncbi:hypothetical protein CMU59_18370 [Elizabethkingia anophelis]|uniref:DUF308 domain-containing protein n=1 Tax=Elizabethkingia anophelis TaxID=1117645 RepID=UPI002011E723|nr:DUF308 domain-containing protein [Elizabethkingia anophelis]MCL1690053.1 DUF308 domain-containing protein [Elizabethkingia anophelis]MDV3575740.1 hypothetical protein [Elizabethkingia anophelis]MDV3601503.1 hypothetical protein [Elizabethkingia anophelis]MDV3608562.1 hypothetical protein [Elizabethkingia anophelis]MDV3640608.1 hypothetical protein [Elizabethkingia anophelis]